MLNLVEWKSKIKYDYNELSHLFDFKKRFAEPIKKISREQCIKSPYNIQNIYDATTIINGDNIDKASCLLAQSKKIRIISDESFVHKCKVFYEYLASCGFNVSYGSFDDVFNLEDIDALMIVTENIKCEKFKLLNSSFHKIINVLPKDSSLKTDKTNIVIKFLTTEDCSTASGIDIVLNCIKLNLMINLKANS